MKLITNPRRPAFLATILATGLASVLSVCAFASSDQSSWIKIADFESSQPMSGWTLIDTANQTEPKVENPQITEVRKEANNANHYLIKKPAAEGIVGNRKALSYLKLPQAIDVGDTYTVYTRINVEYFPNNHAFGLSDLNPADIDKHGYDAFEPTLRVTDKYESDGTKNDGTLMVKVDGGYSKIHNFQEERYAKPLQTDTWYELWYVVNNSTADQGGQVYDVYVRGGAEFPKRVNVYKNADFRMKREQPLIYLLMNTNTGPIKKPYGNGGVRYDDLYMTKGVNLSSPLN
jgi:hypothetical protein